MTTVSSFFKDISMKT